MIRRRLFTLMTLGVLAFGCSSTDIVAPSAAVAPAAPSPTTPSGAWSVTIQTIRDDGPDFCIRLPAVGSVFKADYGVEFSGETVSLMGPDPIDWSSYTATLNGLSFAAVILPWESGGGMCTHYVQREAITGTFSADKSSFSATETWSFTVDSGQVKTITFSWTGARK